MIRSRLIALGFAAGLAFTTAAQAEAPNLNALRNALHLTPSQQDAWTAYAASIATPAAAQQRRRAAADLFPTLPAPRRFDLMEAEMRQELTELHQQSVALETFYATLTPDQQRIFDKQTLPPASDRDSDDR